jgi:hypothetical protein
VKVFNSKEIERLRSDLPRLLKKPTLADFDSVLEEIDVAYANQKGGLDKLVQSSTDGISDLIKIDFNSVVSSLFTYGQYHSHSADRAKISFRVPVFSEYVSSFKSILNDVGNKNDGYGFDISSDAQNTLIQLKKKYTKEAEASASDKSFPYSETLEQPVYALRNGLDVCDCGYCKATGLVTCTEKYCNGKHIYTCPECVGAKKVTCYRCIGDGKTRCGRCRGTNKETVRVNGKRKEKVCGHCRSGKVKCSSCEGKKKVSCRTCSALGRVTCTACYGDSRVYGKVGCKNCEATGRFFVGSYVKTEYQKARDEKLFYSAKEGSSAKKEVNKILGLLNDRILVNRELDKVFQNTQEEGLVHYEGGNEGDVLLKLEEGLKKIPKGLVVSKYLDVQTVPVLSYQYSKLTDGSTGQIYVVDPFDKPRVLLPTINELKKSKKTGSLLLSVQLAFGLIFRTSIYKNKCDEVLALKLFAQLLKADNVVDEKEKEFLLDCIREAKYFSKRDSSQMFKYISDSSTDTIKDKQLVFFDQQVAIEAVDKLEFLAAIDGEFDGVEKGFIDRVKLANGL